MNPFVWLGEGVLGAIILAAIVLPIKFAVTWTIRKIRA